MYLTLILCSNDSSKIFISHIINYATGTATKMQEHANYAETTVVKSLIERVKLQIFQVVGYLELVQ